MGLKEAPLWDEEHTLYYNLTDWQEIREPTEILFTLAEGIESWFDDEWQLIGMRTSPLLLREDYDSTLAIIYENPEHQFKLTGKPNNQTHLALLLDAGGLLKNLKEMKVNTDEQQKIIIDDQFE